MIWQARCVAWLLTAELRRTLGRAARRVEQHFDARVNAGRLVDLAVRCVPAPSAVSQSGVA